MERKRFFSSYYIISIPLYCLSLSQFFLSLIFYLQDTFGTLLICILIHHIQPKEIYWEVSFNLLFIFTIWKSEKKKDTNAFEYFIVSFCWGIWGFLKWFSIVSVLSLFRKDFAYLNKDTTDKVWIVNSWIFQDFLFIIGRFEF